MSLKNIENLRFLTTKRNLENNPMNNPIVRLKLSETRKRLFKEGKLKSNSETLKNSYKNGKISVWNKGIEIDRKKYPNIGHFKKHSEITKIKIREKRKIQICPMLGKHWSEEHKRKLSKSHKGQIPWNKGIPQNEWLSEEHIIKLRQSTFGKKNSKMSEIMKLRWQNPEYRDNIIKKWLKGLMKRPTSLENKFIKIIRRRKLPYKYVGNGDFILGGKCPDFINTNGEKRCIEIRPKCMTQIWSKCSPEEYIRQRQEHFAKYGWNCQVIWQEDFEKNKSAYGCGVSAEQEEKTEKILLKSNIF